MFLSLSLAYKLQRSGNRVLLLHDHPLALASRSQYNIDARMRPIIESAYANSTAARHSAPGRACTKRIFLFAVSPP